MRRRRSRRSTFPSSGTFRPASGTASTTKACARAGNFLRGASPQPLVECSLPAGAWRSMSVLSDVQQLYGSLQTTWEQSRAHLVAHAVLAFVVFLVCGAALPQIAAPHVEPKEIMNNDWFKLAKDTGLIYVALAIPFLAIAAYLALLGKLGQFAVMIIVGLAG